MASTYCRQLKTIFNEFCTCAEAILPAFFPENSDFMDATHLFTFFFFFNYYFHVRLLFFGPTVVIQLPFKNWLDECEQKNGWKIKLGGRNISRHIINNIGIIVEKLIKLNSKMVQLTYRSTTKPTKQSKNKISFTSIYRKFQH